MSDTGHMSAVRRALSTNAHELADLYAIEEPTKEQIADIENHARTHNILAKKLKYNGYVPKQNGTFTKI